MLEREAGGIDGVTSGVKYLTVLAIRSLMRESCGVSFFIPGRVVRACIAALGEFELRWGKNGRRERTNRISRRNRN